MQPTYEHALELLRKYNKSESLLKHAFALEGVMRLWQEKPVKMKNYGA
jgi:predicted hydrolase (HD superfamily)